MYGQPRGTTPDHTPTSLGANSSDPVRHRKVILHCNLLWMSSPKADLHTEKEERFNHADLVPQFSPRIPCYRADFNRRFSAVVRTNRRRGELRV